MLPPSRLIDAQENKVWSRSSIKANYRCILLQLLLKLSQLQSCPSRKKSGQCELVITPVHDSAGIWAAQGQASSHWRRENPSTWMFNSESSEVFAIIPRQSQNKLLKRWPLRHKMTPFIIHPCMGRRGGGWGTPQQEPAVWNIKAAISEVRWAQQWKLHDVRGMPGVRAKPWLV